jgi:hypothetical protein
MVVAGPLDGDGDVDSPSTLHVDQVNPQVEGGGNLYVAVKRNVRGSGSGTGPPPAKNERILIDSLSGPTRR